MPRETCRSEGCISASVTSGYCAKHNQRVWKHGSDETVLSPKRTVERRTPQQRAERSAAADLERLRALDELAKGCTHCGRPWRQHYRLGRFLSCNGVVA